MFALRVRGTCTIDATLPARLDGRERHTAAAFTAVCRRFAATYTDTQRHQRRILLASAVAGSVAGYRVVGGSGTLMEDGICGFVLVQP
jgi:hypothetical protein